MGDVEKAARRYREQQDELEAARAALYEKIRLAHSEGIPMTKIATSAGMSPERIRQVVTEGE